MIMAKGYLVVDGSGAIVGTHKWGGDIEAPCPILPLEGVIIEMTETGIDMLVSLMIGGQPLAILNNELLLDGEKVGALVKGEVVFGK